jgi:hypothetical protein
MRTLYCVLFSLTLAASVVAKHNDVDPDNRGIWPSFKYQRADTELFRDSELSLDLFGSYASRDRVGVRRDRGGGGLGINYFFLRYLGLSADSYVEEWKWPYRVNGSVVGRIPIESLHLAPYAFGGGGREFRYTSQWTLHAGAGIEFRLNPHTGLFADGRRVFADKTGDYTLIRAGLRVAF